MARVALAIAVSLLLGSGCAVTKYERTVTVERDGQGNITSITEVEHTVQNRKTKKVPHWYVFKKGDDYAK